MMNLRRGDRGHDVVILQTKLNELGFPIAIDGIFDGQTDDAVRMLQGEHGLVVDGWVYTATTALIMGLLAAKAGLPVIDTSAPFPPMSAKRREAVFGQFDWVPAGGDSIRILGGWESDNIQKFYIPQLDGVPYYEPDGALMCHGMVSLHRLAGPIFQRFFARVEDAGLRHLIRCYDGAFVPRRMRGKEGLSNHAWGTAMDINAYANPYHQRPAPAGKDGSVVELVPLAHECGIYWGGNFSGRDIDGMHFEVAVVN